ncbi:MAG TPA: PepSY domain-containing protein [Oculatellaceae cyanobacterium]
MAVQQVTRPDLEHLSTNTVRDSLYAFIWRWHFFAGILIAPFLLIFAITGGLFLFKPQIESALYQHVEQVRPAVTSISAEQQVTAALTAFPDSKIEAYTPPTQAGRSGLVRLITPSGEKLTVGINPHSGQVLGSINEKQRPMQIIRNLHGKLLLGLPGEMLQELAASWAFILVLTGIYLWWPRQREHFLTALFPRPGLSGRALWRNWHTITGVWISGLLIFLIITGLPWSVVSGDLIHRSAGMLGQGMPDTGVSWDGSGSRTVKSIVEDEWTTEHAHKLAGEGHASTSHANTPLPLPRVLQIAEQLALPAAFEVRMPVNEHGVYSLVTVRNLPEQVAFVHLDQYTGQVIRDIRWKDFGPLAQAIALGVALHEGRYFGLPNQLLGLFACLGLILLVVTGLCMWWQRRPRGTLAAPTVPKGYRPGPIVISLIVLLSLMIPLWGLSLVVVWLLDQISQRIFRLKRKAS